MILLQASQASTILTQIFNSFKENLPKVLTALFILLIGWIISKIVARVVRNILKRTPIDRLAEKLNDIDVVRRTNIQIVPSAAIEVLYRNRIRSRWQLASDSIIPSGDPRLGNQMVPKIQLCHSVICSGLKLVGPFSGNVDLTIEF